MGSYISFDVGSFRDARERRAVVLQTFFERGGTLIDSSPMYGSAEDVIGWCLPRVRGRAALFSATKVWTPGRAMGIAQMEKSRELWGVERFDLMQVHNLLDWETHLDTLRGWKSEGRVRYVGVTTSHGRRHDELERIMRTQPIDFVQFTYNIADREAERRLLPLAAERGIAVIVNRPFRRAGLFHAVRGHALPDWAAEIDCRNWAHFFLKFIVAHPAVTCAIPATSNPEHMLQNMDAMRGPQPDAALRRRMADHFAAL
ncbi:MAG: aldo/keto reductase [Chromatiales bacterium]|nr:aldo/keto reductase [Chromatiales bacterium]